MADILGADSEARMVFWEEVFQFNNPVSARPPFSPRPLQYPKAVAQIWYSATEKARNEALARYTAAGHEVLLSSCWYLNYHSYGADWKEPGARSGGQFYYCDPRGFEGSEEQKKRVLGGVAALWGEFVDGTNLESVLWCVRAALAGAQSLSGVVKLKHQQVEAPL